MSFKNYSGLFGALLVAAGGMSPMLHIPFIGNWNYWDMDTTLAIIVYFFAATGLLAAVAGKQGLLRFSGWMIFLVLVFTLIATYFKVNDYFSFIPMKKLASKLSGIIHYRWTGWSLIFSGCLVMILSGRKNKIVKQPEPLPEIPSVQVK